jgi:MFS transporter, MHS family, shikimate and dehydroshikimate transport protein
LSVTSAKVIQNGSGQPNNSKREIRKVLFSGSIGSSIEFYDFFLYGTASALVFAKVFFTGMTPVTAELAALGTFAIGYLGRPLGGIIFGHFGDRYGRKRMLFLTIIVMGAASTLIGCLPTPAQVGAWAPVLLILLRLIQGIALGGEWGGATLMAVEYAPKNKRGFYSAFVTIGASIGNLLSSGVLAIVTLLPGNGFLAWGWRIPFLLSVVLLIVGIVVRATLKESPVFLEAQEKKQITKSPLASVLRHEWRSALVVLLVASAPLSLQAVMGAFVPTYAQGHGANISVLLGANAVGNAINIGLFLAVGAWSDRIGRKPIMIAGFALGIVLLYPVLLLIGTPGVEWLGILIGTCIYTPLLYGPLGAYISEQFSTGTRYTGASLGYQLGSTIGTGLTPLIIVSIFAATGGEVVWVAVYLAALFAVALIIVSARRETKVRDLTE